MIEVIFKDGKSKLINADTVEFRDDRVYLYLGTAFVEAIEYREFDRVKKAVPPVKTPKTIKGASNER